MLASIGLVAAGIGLAAVPASATPTWTGTTVGVPTGSAGGEFNTISCTSPGNCVATGGYQQDIFDGDPGAATETAGTWSSMTELPVPVGGNEATAEVSGLACSATGDCTAIGSYDDSSYAEHVMVLADDGGTWTATELNIPSVYEEPQLGGLTCSSVGNCLAVGHYYSQSANQPLLLAETDGVWGAPMNVTLPAGDTNGSLTGASCPSDNNCVVVGGYDQSSGLGQVFSLVETDGSWGDVNQLTSPPFSTIDSISCTDTADCTGVGSYTSNSGTEEGIGITETGGDWSDATVILSDSLLPSLQCFSAGNCLAVGYTLSSNYSPSGILLAQTGGIWGAPAAVPPASGDAADALLDISCTAADSCTVAGDTTNASYSSLPYVYSDAVAAVAVAPDAPTTGAATAGNGQVTLTWSAPSNDGGSAITGYNVYEGTTPGGESTTPVNTSLVDPSQDSYTVTGLTNGSPYYFTVTAVNASGESTPSVEVAATPVAPTPPAVTGVSPSNGPLAGGQNITITGTGFTAGATVQIGGHVHAGNAAGVTDLVVVSSTEITATTAPGVTPGLYNLYVTTPDGTSALVTGDQYTYANPRPNVTSVSPNTGPVGGGQLVTITGSGFVAGATVDFSRTGHVGKASLAATDVTVVSSTEITADTPKAPHATTYDLFVVDPAGTSAKSTGATYTFVRA